MILIDTSAIFAVLDEDDINHHRAAKFWAESVENETTILTNSNLLLEAFALIQRRHGLDILNRFQQGMVPWLQIEWIDPEKHAQAVNLLFSANRRHLSLVDVSAFSTMRRMGVTQVFTFDNHFAEEGFDVLP